MQNESSLRAITTRLNATPVSDLPRISGFLAASLAQCSLEQHFSDPKANKTSVTAHKLKTRITSLLHDRSAAGRLTAAVLIKAVVDNGGPSTLANCQNWASGLVSCLNKPDPHEIKRLYLVTVIRIFALAQHHQSLLRELVTPLLPSFITSCLGLIKPTPLQTESGATTIQAPLIEPVLQCWISLLPRHATVFRPFLARIKLVCQSLLADSDLTTATRNKVIELLCLLVSSAPKNSLSQEWAQMMDKLISSALQTADQLFRAVVEEHESNDPDRRGRTARRDFSKEPKLTANDPAELGHWSGIFDGSVRLATLMTWLEHLVSTATLQLVSIPMGAIVDLTARITAVIVPTMTSGVNHNSAVFEKEASREEREELVISLPQVHLTCLNLLRAICKTCGRSTLPILNAVANQVLETFEATQWHEDMRQVIYDIYSHLLRMSDIRAISMTQPAFVTMIDRCCLDLKDAITPPESGENRDVSREGFLVTRPVPIVSERHEHNSLQCRQLSRTQEAAWTLLYEALKHCPTSLIPRQTRLEMDRLSILSDHVEAMLASTMRPMLTDGGQVTTASVLPFLARSAVDSLSVEALMRPRMPVTYVDELSQSRSSDHQPATGDLEMDDTISQNGDILSSLEASLEEQERTQQDQTTTTAGPTPAKPSSDLEIRDARKRMFDDIGDNLAAPARSIEPAPSRASKLPRLQDEDKEAKSSETDPGSVYVVTEDTDAPTLIQKDFPLDSQPQAAVVGSTGAANGDGWKNDSDSSDFEIPTIDTGLDTDEEGDLL